MISLSARLCNMKLTTVCYIENDDKYLMLHRTKKENDEELPDKIQVQLLKTDPTIPIMERFVKNSEKRGLYNAMDTASIWLERALNEQ